jgi:hypothetical protein
MKPYRGCTIPVSVASKVKAMLRSRFPSVKDVDFNEDDAAAAFGLTERFYVRLRVNMGGWIVEFNDRHEPMDSLNFELAMKSEKLDADAMRDVVGMVSDIVSERTREHMDMQRISAAFD